MNKLMQEYVRYLFDYDRDTGIVTRKVTVASNAHAGNTVGCKNIDHNGKTYLRVDVKSKKYYVHIIIWIWMTGEIPKNHEINHINGNGCDNRWINFRLVPKGESQRNQRLHKSNTSGTGGVCWHKLNQKWQVHINVLGKKIFLGHFHDKEKAIAARKIAEIKYGYHPNHGQARPL